MYFSDLEIFLLLLIAFGFAGVFLWLLQNSKRAVNRDKPLQKREKLSANIPSKKDEPKTSLFESFDYMGTKIYHHDGKYIVVEDNVSRNFNSLNDLPQKYRKMISEMDKQRFSGEKNRYYMENRNGKYIVVFPDGSKKKFKSYNDIPEKLKKILSS